MSCGSDPPKPDAPSHAGWLNRTVLAIGLASLFSDIGHEMATAAMPALLASFGAAPAVLGLIEGLADGLSSFAKLYSGLYSDRLKRRKPLAVAGYFVTASAMASFALATQWWHVLVGRVAGWIGRGARSPVKNVLLSDATTPESYGRAFGLERAMDSAGAVVGPLLALLLLPLLGFRGLFLCTLIPGILAAVLIAVMVQEKPHAPRKKARLFAMIRELPKPFVEYLAGVGVAGLGDFSNTLLIMWATLAWAPHYGEATAATMGIAFYIFYNVVYTISCSISGWLADRYPKHWVLSIGYSLAVIPAVALMWPGESLLKFAIAFGFSGLYMGVWETLENSTAATLLPSDVRGTGFGVLATVNGVGDVLSSVLVAFLWQFVSPVAAMSFVIVAAMVGAVIIACAGMAGAKAPS